MVYISSFRRKEIKYLLNEQQYKKILGYIIKNYASIDEYGESSINNIYFDTPDFKLVRTSLDKPVYKEKLRLRTYGATTDSTNAFIEIKKKYKGIVYKRRISAPYKNALDYLTFQNTYDKNGIKNKFENYDIDINGTENAKHTEHDELNREIKAEIDAFLEYYKNLVPRMAVTYKRTALVGREDPGLRFTFDRDIRWRVEDIDLRNNTEVNEKGEEILSQGEHLMEVKVPAAFPIGLSREFSEMGVFPVSISKYGRGYTAYRQELFQELIPNQEGTLEFDRDRRAGFAAVVRNEIQLNCKKSGIVKGKTVSDL